MSGILRHVVNRSCARLNTQSIVPKRTYLYGPAKNKISGGEQAAVFALMVSIFIAPPVWVLANLEYYKEFKANQE